MIIEVNFEPTCTWEYEGGGFFCSHDVVTVEEFVNNYLGINGPYQTTSRELVCVDCDQLIQE